MSTKVSVLDAPSRPYGIVTKDRVAAVVKEQRVQPTRYFYFLDTNTGIVWETDGYRAGPEGSQHWTLLFFCPKCHHELRLDSMKKQFEIRENGVETAEPFRCSWNSGADGFTGLCGWGAELSPPKQVLLERIVTADGRRIEVQIDAIIRPLKGR